MVECTIEPEYVGTTTNLMLKPEGCSGPRSAMEGSHYTQTPQIVGAMLRSCFTGFERSYAKYMFNVIVEEKCTVDRIFERRALAHAMNEEVLEKVVFVQLHDANRTISCINIPLFESNHQYFGYSYKLTKRGRTLRGGMVLQKGEVLAETPSVIEKEYCNGTQANVILVSHPQVIEDACVISDRLQNKLLAYGFKTHRLFIGQKNVPLLPYGDDENPRLFPHIGEKVRPDGILFGTRPFDPLLAAIECSGRALREPCTQYDDCVIVDKEAVVYDIKVYRDDTRVFPKDENGKERPHTKMYTPSGIQAMLDEYYNGTSVFHANIRDYYCQLDASRGQKYRSNQRIPLTPLAHQQFLTSIAVYPEDIERGTIKRRQFGKDLMDDYVVEITIKYPIPMAVSGKLTDCAGGKGINGETLPLELMPYDDYGNYVDIMMADNAVLRRTNFNRPFEAYVNAARRDVTIDALEMYNAGKVKEAWNHIIGFVQVASPEWARKLLAIHDTAERRTELLEELNNGGVLRMWFPSKCEKGMAETERDIEAAYPPRRSPLTFTNKDGTTTRTEEEFIVGELYIIRLDKTGRESFSISAGRYQQFGTIAKQHSADKYRRPIREQPIKFMGEAECRHLNAYTPQGTTAEIHDRSNNPIVMDTIIRNMIRHETPSNMDVAVDRKKYPLGNNRAMLIANHVLECEGQKFTTRRGNITRENVKFDLDL